VIVSVGNCIAAQRRQPAGERGSGGPSHELPGSGLRVGWYRPGTWKRPASCGPAGRSRPGSLAARTRLSFAGGPQCWRPLQVYPGPAGADWISSTKLVAHGEEQLYFAWSCPKIVDGRQRPGVPAGYLPWAADSPGTCRSAQQRVGAVLRERDQAVCGLKDCGPVPGECLSLTVPFGDFSVSVVLLVVMSTPPR